MADTSLFSLLLLGLQLMSSVVSGAVFLDYQVDSSDVNLIFLECYSDGAAAPNRDAIFEFFNPITQVLQARLSPLPSDRLRYNVTPATEAEIRCFIDEVSSQRLSIAGECMRCSSQFRDTDIL